MKTRLIMVRHGQSLANAENRFAGHSDFDLSELGHRQAELAAEYLLGKEKIDAIYSSDLLRAYNTARPFAKCFGLPINAREGLRELYAGAWEGMKLSDIAEAYTSDLLVWRDDFSNARCTNGESVAELYERMVSFVCGLAKENLEKTLLLTTHATPIRAIECYSRGLDATHMAEVPFVRNSAISIFEYDAQTEKIIPIKTDIVEHLDASLVTAVPTDLKN